MDSEKEFDGIKQADNPMPTWWKSIFGFSILFSIAYVIYFHGYSDWGTGPQFEKQLTEHKIAFPVVEIKTAEDGSNPFRNNEEKIASGKKTFQTICMACHGMDAKGLVGPNLMDAEWIHGNTDETVYLSISKGIAVEKAKLGRGMMPAHESLGQEKIYEVMAWLAKENPSLKKGK